MELDQFARLRPVERCVLRMTRDGLPDDEIGRRLRRSPELVGRMRSWTQVPRSSTAYRPASDPLRPLERCVLRRLDDGRDYGDLAEAFRRSPSFVEFVEQMARYKLSH
jgi:hypothetical protein